MILGFDASTTTCGYAFYDGTAIVDAGFIDISKLKTNKEKAFHIISAMDANPNVLLISHINLEAFLSGFMQGRTRQQTVIMLARFNAVFEYILEEHYNVPVNLISSSTARKKVLGKARVGGMTGKEYVAHRLPEVVSNLSVFMKLNTRGDPEKRNEDIRDAIVMAMA